VLTQCQWIQQSDVMQRATNTVQRIAEMQTQYALTSGAKKAVAAPILLDFVRQCAKYTGSQAVSEAVKMAQALSLLEMHPNDAMTWTKVLDECSRDACVLPVAPRNEWDVAHLRHVLAICGHVTEESTVTRAKAWYASVVSLSSISTSTFACNSSKLKEMLQNCGPVHGNVSTVRIIELMRHSNTAPLTPENKTRLLVFLSECHEPRSQNSFDGWGELIRMVKQCSGMSAHSTVCREDVSFFTHSMALRRARNALFAAGVLESHDWPRDVSRLRRLVSDCENLSGVPMLDMLRASLAAIDALPKTLDVTAVSAVVEGCLELTGDLALDRARAQVDALGLLAHEHNKHRIQALLATCEGLQGSQLLDAARKSIAAEVLLEGPLDAREFGLATMERRFHVIHSLALDCGDLHGSLALDAARRLLDMAALLDAKRDTAELRRIVDYIVGHGVIGCPGIEATLDVLDKEASLATLSDVIQLTSAVIDVDARVSASLPVAAAKERIKQALTTDWPTLLAHTQHAVLLLLHQLGCEFVDAHMSNSSSLHSMDGFRQSLMQLHVKLQAVERLNTEAFYPHILQLLDVIDDIDDTDCLARARSWRQAVEALTTEDNASRIRLLVAQCHGLSGCALLDAARMQVEVLCCDSFPRALTNTNIHIYTYVCI